MIYDPKGVTFSGDEPKVFHGKSEQGNTTQRGFCGKCGSVLLNHVSEVSRCCFFIWLGGGCGGDDMVVVQNRIWAVLIDAV